LKCYEDKFHFVSLRNSAKILMNEKVGDSALTVTLKLLQFILKITASCNKRMIKDSTLIISSMKSPFKGAHPFGRLMEELHGSKSQLIHHSFICPQKCTNFSDYFLIENC